jgi:hypothetical protein
VTDDLSTLLQPVHYRIQAYLSGVGLFNPELANHDAVRDLIIDSRAALLRLARENRILDIKNAGTLANNLCPDHRDKQAGKICLACTIERAEAELAISRETIKRLNRRVQVAEAGVAEKIKAKPRIFE